MLKHWDALPRIGFVKSMNSRNSNNASFFWSRLRSACERVGMLRLLLDDPTILAILAAMTDVSKETQR
jgi:hypothetical protein